MRVVFQADVGGKTKDQKTAENKKKKRRDSQLSAADDDDVNQDGMDWWSKYHASMDLVLTVRLAVTQTFKPYTCID